MTYLRYSIANHAHHSAHVWPGSGGEEADEKCEDGHDDADEEGNGRFVDVLHTGKDNAAHDDEEKRSPDSEVVVHSGDAESGTKEGIAFNLENTSDAHIQGDDFD